MPTLEPQSQSENTPPANDLDDLAEFIHRHAVTSFDSHLAVTLSIIAEMHDDWAENCKATHYHTEIPCEEYLNGLSLGIAWLKGRIEDRP